MPHPYHLCTEDDDFVRDNVRWVVLLDNDELVYEDDGRPGVEPPSAWIRLGTYCREQGRHIVRMWLQFRSNRVEVTPSNADGYFLAKAVSAVWGEDSSVQAYIAGSLGDDGLVHATRWRTPDLVPLEHETRQADPEGPFLIVRVPVG